MRLLIILTLCFMYATLNVSGTALIKNELINHGLADFKSYFQFIMNYKVMFGICLNFISMLVVMKALSMEKFSFIFPVSIGINFAMTITAGYFIFGDRLSFFSFTGLFFILAGILLMSIGR
jgi:multidrug transporter EmrE-like cation transporter